jgi:hypothetical protein
MHCELSDVLSTGNPVCVDVIYYFCTLTPPDSDLSIHWKSDNPYCG